MLVHIACSDGSEGSGVIVSATGHVLTAGHVVTKDATCTAAIRDKSGPRSEIQMLYPITGLDGAVMLLDQTTPHFATYCPMDTHLKEARVIVKGFHAGSKTDPHVTEGIISSSDISAGFIDTDVTMNPGQSGGPVFLKNATALIGIVAGAKFNSVGMVETFQAVPAELLAPAARLQLAEDCAPQVKIFTLAEHEKRLNQKIEATRADYERLITEVKTASEAQRGELRTKLSFSELQLQRLVEDKANLQTSYTARVEELRLLRQELEKLRGGSVSEASLAAAQDALFEGDTARARQAFEDIRTETTQAVTRLASAEFGLGKIADDELRWHDAYQHFAAAARLDPSFDHLLMATAFATHVGLYDVANVNSRQMIAAAIEEFGAGSTEHALALDRHATALTNLGFFTEAEPHFRQALEIDANTIGTEHPNHAARLNNLALLLEATGRYDEAEIRYRQAMDIDAKTVGTDHPDYAVRLNNLGLLLETIGRFDEAEMLYRQAMEIDAKTIGTDHPNHAIRLNNLALLLDATGRYDEAEPLFRQTIEIDAKTLGTDHPSYATSLNNLANVLQVTGGYDEAERLYRQAMEIDAKTIGTEHPEFATRLNNLATLLEKTDRLDEAERLYRQAIQIDVKTIGTQHPQYATRISNLGIILETTGRYDEAEQLFRQALQIGAETLGSDHPDHAIRLNNLATLMAKTENYEEAERLYRQAIEILEASFGKDHGTTQGVSDNLKQLLKMAADE